MDYRYIHPLYTNDDYESARDYLADDISQYIQFEGMDSDLLKILAKDMVTSLYGVNIVKMANIYEIQKFVADKYLPSIIKYFWYCNIDAKIIEIQYQEIIPEIIAYKSGQPDFKPLKQYNPNVEWTNLSYTNDADINLVNPLNSLSHCFLEINGITEYKFVEEIAPLYFGDRFSDLLPQWIKEKKTISLTLCILPDDNLYRINKLVKSIHKYF